MSTSQQIVTLALAVLSSSALSVLITKYFDRRKTGAEAGKLIADSHKTDAEASASYADQIRDALSDLRGTVTALSECLTGKARAEARAEMAEMKLGEALFHNGQVEEAKKLLIEQNRQKDEQITRLRQQLIEAGVGTEE